MTIITIPRAVAEQALEAMRCAVPTGKITLYEWDKAMAALRAALAQQRLTDVQQEMERSIESLKAALAQQAEPVEPVAWVRLEAWKSGQSWPDDCFTALPAEGLTPVYTAPPQRKPLMEGMLMGVYIDFDRAADPAWSKAEYLLHFARAIERAHGIGGSDE